MAAEYKMKPRYDKEKINNITTARTTYKFPKSFIINTERAILRSFKKIPEKWRDILKEFGEKGISGSFGRLIFAELFTHTFFFNDDDTVESSHVAEDSFRDRIHIHGFHGPHHGPHGHHHGHDRDDFER